jgi:hypothetical protein
MLLFFEPPSWCYLQQGPQERMPGGAPVKYLEHPGISVSTRSAAPRGATLTAPQGRTARTAPAASATTGRCRGGRGREQW